MGDIEKKLQSVGLSEQEARVFAAVARTPRASVSDLARISGVKRTSVYEYLDALLAAGLVRKAVVGKRIHYEAQPPQSLVRFARQREKLAQEQIRRAEDLAVDLEPLMAKGGSRPQVRVYEGRAGINEAHRVVLDTWQDLYAIFTPKHFFDMFSFAENHELLMMVKKREIKLYNLVERSPAADKRLAMREYDAFVKNKLLPQGVSFSSHVLASTERLALVSFPTQTATVIDDSTIASVQRTLMKTLWGSL
jgi:sugar-specific transcriptional regulator TrmB